MSSAARRYIEYLQSEIESLRESERELGRLLKESCDAEMVALDRAEAAEAKIDMVHNESQLWATGMIGATEAMVIITKALTEQGND